MILAISMIPMTSDNVNTNDKVNNNDNDNVNVDDNDNDNVNANVNDNDNVNQGTCLEDQGQSPFADVNDNDNQGTDGVRGMPTCLDNQEQTPFADVIANANVNQGTCLADVNDNNNYEIVYYRCSYSNPRSGFANNIFIRKRALQINVNVSLQSWLDDDNIIVNAPFPESFTFVISGPSECGKTFFLKNLFISSIHFERLYIIGATGN